MGFDFAVALVPRKANITDETYKKNSRQAVKLIQQILAMIKPSHPEVYNESAPIVNEFVNILRKNQFRSIPYVERLKFERHLKDHVYSIGDIIYQLMGNEQCHELDVMIRNDVRLERKKEVCNLFFQFSCHFFFKDRIIQSNGINHLLYSVLSHDLQYAVFQLLKRRQ